MLINFNFSFHIGHSIAEIDRRIMQIQLPKQIRRNFCPISEREHFHSTEWRNILLYAAYPMLKDILPQR